MPGETNVPTQVCAPVSDPEHVAATPVDRAFDVAGLISYLGDRAVPGLERVEELRYSRTVRTERGGQAVVHFDFGQVGTRSEVIISSKGCALSDLAEIDERVAWLTGATRSSAAGARALASDAVLRPFVAARPGLRVPGTWDPFELAVRAILGQQVSVRAAVRLAQKVAATFGEPLARTHDGFSCLFPTAGTLGTAPLEELGLPRSRAVAIRGLAHAACTGQVSFNRTQVPSADALIAMPGIGPWTAAYIRLRGFGVLDAFPASDLGIRQMLGSVQDPLASRQVLHVAEPWRPYRGLAAVHLWTAMAQQSRPAKG